MEYDVNYKKITAHTKILSHSLSSSLLRIIGFNLVLRCFSNSASGHPIHSSSPWNIYMNFVAILCKSRCFSLVFFFFLNDFGVFSLVIHVFDVERRKHSIECTDLHRISIGFEIFTSIRVYNSLLMFTLDLRRMYSSLVMLRLVGSSV